MGRLIKIMMMMLVIVITSNIVLASYIPVDSRTSCDYTGENVKCKTGNAYSNVINDKGDWESCESALTYKTENNSLIIKYGREIIPITYEYEKADTSLISSAEESVNFIVEKNGCSLHYYQNFINKTEDISKLKYEIPEGFTFKDNVLVKGDIYINLNEAKDLQNVTITYDEKTNEVVFEGDNIKNLDPSVGLTMTGQGGQDTSAGTDSWTNPQFITADDISFAISTPDNSDEISYWLTATNFSFDVPEGATITGIEAQYYIYDDYDDEEDEEGAVDMVKVIIGGTVTGDDMQTGTGSLPDNTWWTITYGGDGELWGTTPTVEDVNSDDFGVAITITPDEASSARVKIDYVNMDIYYTESSDDTYPQFSNFGSNNNTLQGYGTIVLNATILNTNGTAGVEFNGNTYSATNVSDLFTATFDVLENGTFEYFWYAYGNGTSGNYNNSQNLTYYVQPPSLGNIVFEIRSKTTLEWLLDIRDSFMATFYGLIKLWKTDTAGVCYSETEGTIYYDNSLKKPCYCNSTDWVQMDGGGTC